jgi:hypothetical protein
MSDYITPAEAVFKSALIMVGVLRCLPIAERVVAARVCRGSAAALADSDTWYDLTDGQKSSRMYHFCKNGTLETIRRAVALYSIDRCHDDAVHVAAVRNAIDILQWLGTRFGLLSLNIYYICTSPVVSPSTVRWLVEHHREKPGLPYMLYCACIGGNLAVAQWAGELVLSNPKLAAALTPEARSDLLTAACRVRSLEIATYVVDTLSATMDDECEAFLCAAGHLPMLQFLHDRFGPQPRHWVHDILMVAYDKSDIATVEWLDETYRLTVEDVGNYLLLHACGVTSVAFLRHIVRRFDLTTSNCGVNVVDLLYQVCGAGAMADSDADRAALFIDGLGCDTTQWTESGREQLACHNLLERACYKGDVALAEWLFNRFGYTALDLSRVDLALVTNTRLREWIIDLRERASRK